MNEILNQLKPEGVWRYFGEILRIPRPSKKEEKIREYLLAFGREHRLETIAVLGPSTAVGTSGTS